jgi:hypothetical protein
LRDKRCFHRVRGKMTSRSIRGKTTDIAMKINIA